MDREFFLIEKMSEQIFMPLCVGGGVSTLNHFEDLLNVGADKISVNSILLENPEFVKQAADNFGSQCVVASIDYKSIDGKPFVFNHREDWSIRSCQCARQATITQEIRSRWLHELEVYC